MTLLRISALQDTGSPPLFKFATSICHDVGWAQAMEGLDGEGRVLMARAVRFLLAHLDDGLTALYLPHLQRLAAIAQRHGRRRARSQARRRHVVN